MGGAAARCRTIDLRCYHLPDTIDITQHLIVPEPQHLEPLCAHEVVASRVINSRFGVLAAVDFNDDPRLQTREVSDIWADANLPAELVAFELAEPQVLPEPTLRILHVLAKTSCALVCHGAAAPPIPTFPHKGGRGRLLCGEDEYTGIAS